MGVSLQSMIVTSSQTINIPANVSMMWVMGAASGGGATGGQPGGGSQGMAGAGAGEICHMLNLPVTPGGTLTISIGAAGAGTQGPTNGATGGGDVTFGPFALRGPLAALAWGNGGNKGGGPRGASGNGGGSLGIPPGPAIAESVTHFGGSGTDDQGAGSTLGLGNGGNVGGAISTDNSGGGPGAFWMAGGNAGNFNANGTNATGYGAGGGGGGGGGSGSFGGNGKTGVLMLFWIG